MTFYWIKNTTLKKSECGQALHRVGSVENVYHMRILKSECWCVSNINCLFMKSWKYYLCSIDSWRLQSWHVQACTENAFLTEIADTKCVLIYRHCIVQWAVQLQQPWWESLQDPWGSSRILKDPAGILQGQDPFRILSGTCKDPTRILQGKDPCRILRHEPGFWQDPARILQGSCKARILVGS